MENMQVVWTLNYLANRHQRRLIIFLVSVQETSIGNTCGIKGLKYIRYTRIVGYRAGILQIGMEQVQQLYMDPTLCKLKQMI